MKYTQMKLLSSKKVICKKNILIEMTYDKTEPNLVLFYWIP
jgi:hypothetical protein